MAAPVELELMARCSRSASDASFLQVTLAVTVTVGGWLAELGWMVGLGLLVGPVVVLALQAAMAAIERTTAAG